MKDEGGAAAAFGISGGLFRPLKTLRPFRDQPLAMLIEIDQSEGRQMPMVVLHDAAIAHLGITEDTLQAVSYTHLDVYKRQGAYAEFMK